VIQSALKNRLGASLV